MRAVGWAAGFCYVVLLAACAVSVPELSVGSGGGASGGGGSAGASGSGGAIDCTATSDCSAPGCVCAKAAPAHFLGPILFATSKAPIKCPAGFRTDPVPPGFTYATADQVSCFRCECGTNPCGEVTVNAYSGPGCDGVPATIQTKVNYCQDSFGIPIKSVLVSDAPTSMSNSCHRSGGGVKDRPPGISQDYALICTGEVGAGCATGTVCLLAPQDPFEACVYAPGQVSCPSAFPNEHVIYTEMTDGRKCSDCTCGVAAATCPTTFEAFSSANCTTGSFQSGQAGTCFSAPPGESGQSIEVHVKTPCTPGGGLAEGLIEKSGPYTVCCP